MIGASFLREFFAGDRYIALDQDVENPQAVGDANDGYTRRLFVSIVGQR